MFCRLILLLLLTTTLLGCKTSQPAVDPVITMMDRSRSVDIRLAAARRAAADRRDDKDYQAALRRLAVQMGHPTELRTHAIDAMVQQDEARAKQYFRTAIASIEHWPTLTHLCEVAVKRNWRDFVPALVRSYQRESRVVGDEERPERKALLELQPGRALADIVFGVVNADDGPNVSERSSAWALLCRLAPADRQRQLLAGATSDSIVVEALRAAANDLGIIPTAREDVTRLIFLHTQDRRTWNFAKQRIAQLTAPQRVGLEARHVPLFTSSQLPMNQSRTQLLASLARSLRGGPMHLKVAPKTGKLPQHPQQLTDWQDQLSWADLATIRLIRQAMASPTIRRAWFAQADADLADEKCEYGGLLFHRMNRGLFVKAYEPLLKRHDRTFIPPPSMVADGYEAVAHYHFHAQQHDNIRYASPGSGDRQNVADRQRVNGIVLTFIDANTLNVDFYRHGGVVIDLGEVRR